MPSLPWVKWYSSKWLSSPTRMKMTPLQRCIYLELLFCCYECGGRIPNDKQQLTRMAMVTAEEFETAWPTVSQHFQPCETDAQSLVNRVALDVIGQQTDYHEAKVQAGRAGGKASGRSRSKTSANSEAIEIEIEESKNETQIKSKNETDNRLSSFDYDSSWMELLSVYPPRGKTQLVTAEALYREALLTAPDREALHRRVIVAVTGKWAASKQWRDGYVQSIAKFVKEMQWLDEPAPADTEGTPPVI